MKQDDFCITCVKNNNLNVSIKELKLLKNNNSFYEYLFSHLNKGELAILMSNIYGEKNFTNIIMKNFTYLFTHLDPCSSNNMIIYLIENNIELNIITNLINKDELSEQQYLRILYLLKNKITKYKELFENENKTIYTLAHQVEENESIILYDKFERLAILPLIYQNGNEYLEYIFKNLNININDIEYFSNGNYGCCFKINDLVLKIASKNEVWEIPMFYRINDFIVRKKIGNAFLSVTPYGNLDLVTNQDIKDALNDFNRAGIDLTDTNYKSNFAVVDYEIPKNMFRDVDGIRKYIDIPESISYQKKKVKLIDQDYIYFNNDKNKKHGVIGEYWKEN